MDDHLAESPRSRTAGQERRRIEEELHRSPLQTLFAVTLTLAAAAELAPGPVAQRLAAAIDDINAAVSDVRRTVQHNGIAVASGL